MFEELRRYIITEDGQRILSPMDLNEFDNEVKTAAETTKTVETTMEETEQYDHSPKFQMTEEEMGN